MLALFSLSIMIHNTNVLWQHLNDGVGLPIGTHGSYFWRNPLSVHFVKMLFKERIMSQLLSIRVM